jgi:hypothetical protein
VERDRAFAVTVERALAGHRRQFGLLLQVC